MQRTHEEAYVVVGERLELEAVDAPKAHPLRDLAPQREAAG